MFLHIYKKQKGDHPSRVKDARVAYLYYNLLCESNGHADVCLLKEAKASFFISLMSRQLQDINYMMFQVLNDLNRNDTSLIIEKEVSSVVHAAFCCPCTIYSGHFHSSLLLSFP